jgi:hypothetical protein
VLTDALGEGGARKTLLLAGATDVQISLDAVADAKLLVITTVPKDPNEDPTEILLRFNSITGEQRSVAPLADCKEGFLVLTTTGLTSLFASNPGATDTELTVGLAGD